MMRFVNGHLVEKEKICIYEIVNFVMGVQIAISEMMISLGRQIR